MAKYFSIKDDNDEDDAAGLPAPFAAGLAAPPAGTATAETLTSIGNDLYKFVSQKM